MLGDITSAKVESEMLAISTNYGDNETDFPSTLTLSIYFVCIIILFLGIGVQLF